MGKYLNFAAAVAVASVVTFGATTAQAAIDTGTVIPLPAGLVLFLSGLVGIGVLGRYKAKRRELTTEG